MTADAADSKFRISPSLLHRIGIVRIRIESQIFAGPYLISKYISQSDLFDIHSIKLCWKDTENEHKWSWKVLENAQKRAWKAMEKRFRCSVCTLVCTANSQYDLLCVEWDVKLYTLSQSVLPSVVVILDGICCRLCENPFPVQHVECWRRAVE